ncbi:glycosyl hydrolase family 18 protein [Actinomadura sp. HBU206391]|uniref:glycosyl hydrolase family 18 protein n=1 Tax=Actinomadura sp. HBU206391 TaxID=2731692 RepID=UPI001650C373|nr:glycosyl hydrolase family 18 protein [Actinomadura sp. HBU206391]MBC6463380.1 cellulose binding domain-containing protein [Actinomadura sp. HBU206391]
MFKLRKSLRSGRRRRAVALLGAMLLPLIGTVVAAPPASAAAVTASCAKTSDWGTGFEGKCTITNGTGSTVNGWKVEFDLPSGTTIGSSWDAVRTSTGNHHAFTNAGWNGTLNPGATASFGFNGSGGGTFSGCLVNGAACDGSGGGGGDTQAPSTPANLRSTGKSASSVSLAWNAATDNVGVTGYDVYQGATRTASVTGTSTTVSGLSASTAYTFTVRARDAAGNASSASNAVSVTTDAGGGGGGGGNKVIGYFAQWGVYQRAYHVKNIDTSGSAAKLTHINYAFGNVQNGQCTIGDSYADYDRAYSAAESVDGVADTWDAGALRGSFNQLRKLKKKHPHIKVIWSFGGWTWSGGFGQAAANPAAFANSCYNLVEDPRWADVFDGIDIDWEYPNACGLSCDTSGFSSFRTLMSALRSRFGSSNLVTAAITADGTSGGKIDAADYGGAAQYVDWYLPMTYDYFGAFDADGPTAPHSPLTSYSGIPVPGFYSDAAIQKLKSKGVPASKLLLGVGFYGRGWTGVSQSAPGGSATGAAPGTYEAGIEDYKVLKTRCPSTGTVGGTAYAYCGNQWWSYDTPGTIGGKMSYAKNQGLAGSFFWELSGDTTGGELITAVRNGLG